jgi:hypothetical protein
MSLSAAGAYLCEKVQTHPCPLINLFQLISTYFRYASIHSLIKFPCGTYQKEELTVFYYIIAGPKCTRAGRQYSGWANRCILIGPERGKSRNVICNLPRDLLQLC